MSINDVAVGGNSRAFLIASPTYIKFSTYRGRPEYTNPLEITFHMLYVNGNIEWISPSFDTTGISLIVKHV